MADYNVLIDTPENLALEAEVAGFGGRCIAAMVDYFALSIVMIIMAIFFISAIADNEDPTWAIAGFIIFQFLLLTFYHLFFELLWNGQTPGKMIFGLRVVQSNGLPLSAGSSLIRNFVRLVDFLPILYGVGLTALFVTKHSQRLGDLAAGTLVIYERPTLTVHTLRENTQVKFLYGDPDPAVIEEINARLLTPQDRRLVFDYLQRRGGLDHRELLVVPLAQKLAATLSINRNNLHHAGEAERFIEQIAHAINQQPD